MKLTIKEITLSAIFASSIAIGAMIKIPFPLVPITLQLLMVNLTGLLLGKKCSVLAVSTYLIMGLIGLPVFAGGGGLMYIMKPTFGYLLGFLLGVFCSNLYLSPIKEKTTMTYMVAGIITMTCVYSLGLTYFFVISNFYLLKEINWSKLLMGGFLMTLPSDILMCFIGSILAKRLEKYRLV